ncbi:cytochrome P450 724B1 isoform X3 [Cucurbita pepo subsp. pepo]|uniref:cytochrome P450 724B1 isoform X3 n=1 Tax=Cucurbita pepo subsp. pepo TaxID=3664 RepID=UPI000C9D34D4|nr:cytochrome P450 724B1 isoform X3 [Cucurbita pepo subsp. pepo]
MEAPASFSPLTIALSLAMAAVILCQLLLKLFAAATPSPSLPPGCMGFPFVGETLSFLKPHHSNSIGTFLQRHCSRFGKVFKSHLFGSRAIVSCDRELNMFILQNDDKLFKVSYPKAMHGILGSNSLIIAAGDTHRKLRNVVVSFVSWCKSNPTFLHCVDKLSVSLMDSWRSQTRVLFCKEVKMFALSVMVKELLGIDANESIGSRILDEFETYMKGFVSLPLNLPGTPYYKAVKARAKLSGIVKEIMRERKKKGLVVGVEKEGDDHENFLDVIMSNWKLDEEEIVSVVLDILLGGYETTATLMGLIVYFLAHSPPNVLANLKQQHQQQLLNLIYGTDIFIPSGWKVHPVFSAIHLDPTLHPYPQQFNPWRWRDDKEMSKKVTPFGGGPRLCPGIELAKLEIAFFLHHLVLNYRWKTSADECPLAYPYVEFKRDLLLEIEPCSC